jgi:ketosteroid isomerase-like protein
VEVIRRFLDALRREDMTEALAGVDPDVVIDDLDIAIFTERHGGHAGFVKWLTVWGESWDGWRFEDIEVVPVGEDVVIATFMMFVTGRGSGIELARPDAITCRLRAGKIAEIAYYNDQQQAREAVGLRA